MVTGIQGADCHRRSSYRRYTQTSFLSEAWRQVHIRSCRHQRSYRLCSIPVLSRGPLRTRRSECAKAAVILFCYLCCCVNCVHSVCRAVQPLTLQVPGWKQVHTGTAHTFPHWRSDCRSPVQMRPHRLRKLQVPYPHLRKPPVQRTVR